MPPKKQKKKPVAPIPTSPSDIEDDKLDIKVEANFGSVTPVTKTLVAVLRDFKKSMEYQSNIFDKMILESKKQTEKVK